MDPDSVNGGDSEGGLMRKTRASSVTVFAIGNKSTVHDSIGIRFRCNPYECGV